MKEDKDQDSYFIDPFIIDPPKVFDPVSNPISIPSFSEPELSSNESTLENRMTSKVYLRKKVAIPRLIQV